MKKIRRGGITYGKSHAKGGIPVKNNGTGEMLEVEGGEGIVNKRSMASDKMVTINGKKMTICEAVSQLNEMEGGVQFSCDDVEHKQFIEEMARGGELERGTRTEKEHIDTLRKLYEKRITPSQATKEVAKEHLKEDPRYYSKLAKMENKMSDGSLIAPNGKKSNLTIEQYKLVRTPKFKSWFGDWENDPANASKVVDENGEPLVVYHGTYTENPFHVFDFDKGDLGFHFGTYEQAKNRLETKLFFKNRKSIVNSFFLSIKTIFEVSDIGEWEYPQRYIDMLLSDGLISESDAKKNKFYRLVQREENKPIREFLLSKYGNSVGFQYNNKYEGEGKSFIVLSPNQIKLANGSNTTFDGINPDIRFDVGGVMKQGGQTKDNPFAQFGLKKDFVGSWQDKMDYFLKKSDNYCDVEKKYCSSNIDIDRADMPQIYEEYIPEYVDFLETQGVDSYKEYDVKVGSLKPTQKNISLPRMARMLHRLLEGYYTDTTGKKLNPLKRVIVATKDGYILDGHHRWASSLFLSPNNTVDILRVDTNIKDLVPISKNFGMVEFQKFMFGGRLEVNKPWKVKGGNLPKSGITLDAITDNGVEIGFSTYLGKRGLVNSRDMLGRLATLTNEIQRLFPNILVVNGNLNKLNFKEESDKYPNLLYVEAKEVKANEWIIFRAGLDVRKKYFEDITFVDIILSLLSNTYYPISPFNQPIQFPKSRKKRGSSTQSNPFGNVDKLLPNVQYRFKTGEEFEKEYGSLWRTKVGWSSNVNGDMDDLFGQKIVMTENLKLNNFIGKGLINLEPFGIVADDTRWSVSFSMITSNPSPTTSTSTNVGGSTTNVATPPTTPTSDPSTTPIPISINTFLLGVEYRFKTQEEFEDQYGPFWREAVEWSREGVEYEEGMDFLFGQKLVLNESSRERLANAINDGSATNLTNFGVNVGKFDPLWNLTWEMLTVDNLITQQLTPTTQVAPIVQTSTQEEIDSKIQAIQVLLDSFTEDEIDVRRFLLNQITQLRLEKEKLIKSVYFEGDMRNLLSLYLSRATVGQAIPIVLDPCALETPSGKPSQLNYSQYQTVRTPEFKNWFGDWELAYQTKNYNDVSKAINEETGEPLVMYHGKSRMRVEATRFNLSGFPIKYFAKNLSYSQWFANTGQGISVLYEFYVKVVNPIDLSKVGLDEITPDVFKLIVSSLYGYDIKTPLINPSLPMKAWVILRANPAMLKEIRDNTNYDGFILYEDNPQDTLPNGEANTTLDFTTFLNNQQKAADGRNTTFFNEVEDIRFARGGFVNNNNKVLNNC